MRVRMMWCRSRHEVGEGSGKQCNSTCPQIQRMRACCVHTSGPFVLGALRGSANIKWAIPNLHRPGFVHCFTVAIWDWLEFQVDPKAEKDMDMCDVHWLSILIWASWRVDRALTCSCSAICSKTQLDWASHSKPQNLSECLFPFKHATIPVFERPNSEKNILTNTGDMTHMFNSSLQLNIPLGNQSNIVKHHESQIDWPHCNAHLGARARLGQNMLPVWQKWSEETMLWTVVKLSYCIELPCHILRESEKINHLAAKL